MLRRISMCGILDLRLLSVFKRWLFSLEVCLELRRGWLWNGHRSISRS
jgi:hypothetical protein